ncbi:four helix bundle protein [Flavilitoribacter nigricans]|uniref:Four helix bundle protein n=1 Tax=Flavilitoribacter nigricans (strain ATCC 23147 / DSM 23189 / NBRC 102662 / NCIMB 1420 / SS-2) TaxID=1122177 RepID=A0A2D0N827_FLAN2|nr:four helix bundle protein [Flavilitoribacter nigricans]PHN04645.1 four helix bundle protein [Flavilitoribacter nigricans DSM 23189 = NBRC 102662]
MHNFRKLHVWNDAMELAGELYELLEKFPNEEKYGLVSQMKRCAVSIPSNIAEGAGRNTKGEFRQFLGIATASSYELETQLLLSRRMKFIGETDIDHVLPKLHALQKRIYKFKNTLN